MSNEPSERPAPSRRGGGCLIAAGVLLGPVVGTIAGQPSLGLVIGLALGVVGAVVVFLVDRRR